MDFGFKESIMCKKRRGEMGDFLNVYGLTIRTERNVLFDIPISLRI